ncbi:MAG TPA: hypothetical protein VGK67_25180 [Myxococcales bacterium]
MIAALSGLLLLASGANPPLFVDSHSVVPDPDGSRARPFRTIAAALQAASEGDTIDLGTGLVTERVVVAKRVTLRGGKAAVIASPDATGTVVDLQAPATLEHLAIQGGEIGVRARNGARLSEVDCSGQRRAAVLVSGSVAIRGGRLSGLFDRPDLVGIEAEAGSALEVIRTRLEGPFRWAIRGRQAAMALSEVEVEGSVGGVSFEDGSRGSLVGSVLAQGREAALQAKASTVEVKDVLVSRWERGLDALDGSAVTVEDGAVGFCNEAGLTAQGGSRLTVRNLVYVGPARLAAIASIGSQLRVSEGLVQDPGATGVALHGGRGEVTGTVIRGARSETEGDALYAEAADLDVRGVFAEASSGNGLTVVGGKVRVLGLEVYRSQGAGIRAESAARVQAEGVQVQESTTGVSVVGGSQVRLAFGRFVDEAVKSVREGP